MIEGIGKVTVCLKEANSTITKNLNLPFRMVNQASVSKTVL